MNGVKKRLDYIFCIAILYIADILCDAAEILRLLAVKLHNKVKEVSRKYIDK